MVFMSTRSSENFVNRLQAGVEAVFPGLSLAEVARRLGCHANTIHNYFQKGRSPSFDFLVALASSGADVHWLLTGQGTPLADENRSREARVEASLTIVSRADLMAEVDRRVNQTVRDGIQLLKELRGADLGRIAKKIKPGDPYTKLDDAEMELVRKVRRAFFMLSDVEWWHPDLLDESYQPYVEFLTLHREVTGDPKFRAVFYADEQNMPLRHGATR